KVSLSGGADILTDAGSANLLLNVGKDVTTSGGGGGANCCDAVIEGNILAVNGKVSLTPGLVQGKICAGGDISIVSGSSVVCEEQICVPEVGCGEGRGAQGGSVGQEKGAQGAGYR